MEFRRHLLTIAAVCLVARAVAVEAQENTWTTHGPTNAGVVVDVTVGDTAFAATLNGVFRSDDGGATWSSSGFEGLPVYRIVTVRGAAIVFALSYSALFASRDQGKTWARLAGVPSGEVAIDPWNPSNIYIGAGDASVWRTTDAGSNWQRLSKLPGNSSGVYGFAFDSRAVFALTLDEADGLVKMYRSPDSGATWTLVSSLPSRSTGIASGSTAGVVYSGVVSGFCRSADSAATWTCSSFPTSPNRILEIPGPDAMTAPRFVASAGNDIYVSADAGATWVRAGGELGSLHYFGGLASDASGSSVLAGTDLGVFRSLDGGLSWSGASTGLQATIIPTLAVDPQAPSTVWAAGDGLVSSSNPGLFRSTDSGLTWESVAGPGSLLTPGAFAIDPRSSSTLYGASDDVFRSEDGGALWTGSRPPGGARVHAIAIDSVSRDRIWAASDAGLFHSEDGARTWESHSAIGQAVYSLLVGGRSPANLSTLYAGSYFEAVPDADYPNYTYFNGGSLFVSTDGGASFAKLDHDFGSPVTAIVADHFDARTLYVGTESSGFSRSEDGGSHWETSDSASGVDEIFSLVADPARPGRLYAATNSGVQRTTDGGRTWQPFSSGLPGQFAQVLAISPDGRWLHAGTSGSGVFELDLVPSHHCSPSATRLCLVGGRYAVDLQAARAGETPSHPGSARSLSDRAGYFSLPFATGEPDLPEVAVKMLADGSFGSPGAPFFYSSLTTLPYKLTVTDTVTGRIQTYANHPDAPFCGGADLPFDEAAPAAAERSSPANAGESLALLGGRFSVLLEARHPRSGAIVSSAVVLSGDDFGVFSLPGISGDPQFPEVVVKMVDARSFAGAFWFFQASLTSLDYVLTVTDSLTGAVRTYSSTSPLCGAADTSAFTDPTR